MSYDALLLESKYHRLLENGAIRDLESIAPTYVSGQFSVYYPKTNFEWIDRTGITSPDVSGLFSTSGLTSISTGTAGYLVIAIDGSLPSMNIGIAVIYWDERGNPIAISNTTVVLSGTCKNALGYYIATNGPGVPPYNIVANVTCAAGYTVLVTSIVPSGTINLHYRLF